MVAGTLASRSFGGSFPMSGSEVPVPFMQKTTCSKSVTAAPKENRCLCGGGVAGCPCRGHAGFATSGLGVEWVVSVLGHRPGKKPGKQLGMAAPRENKCLCGGVGVCWLPVPGSCGLCDFEFGW